MLKIFRPVSQKIFKRAPRQLIYRYFSVDAAKDTRISFEEVQIPVPWGHVAGKFWGDKNKPPVLALHGWQDNANSFDALIPLLNLPSVLAIDLPGHGLSSHFPAGKNYDFEEFLILINRILQHYNLTKLGVLGHSLGAAIGFIYAGIFPNQIKWLINFENAASLLAMHRYNTPQTFSSAIDMSIEMENKKASKKMPAYKLSRLVLMNIRGSLGSICSPEAAVTLLQRGIKEASDPLAIKVDEKLETESDLKSLLDNEMKIVKGILSEHKEGINEILLQLKKSLKEAEENAKNYFSNKDDKYYILLRDPLMKIQAYQSIDMDLILEAAKHITCPVLSLRAKHGFLHGNGRKVYEKSLEILKASSECMEHHEVDGKWWGPTDQRPLLCLHGWLDNANTFDTLIPLLSPELSYLAIDLPGHGLSSHFPPGFQYKNTDYIGTVRRIQKHFKWPKVSLMGHSFGAQSSLLFSSMFPKDVDFFIALDILKSISLNPPKFFKEQSTNIQKFLQNESFSRESSPLYSKKELIERRVKASRYSLTEKTCQILLERGTENVDGLLRLLRDVRLRVNTEIFFTFKESLQCAKSITCDVLIIQPKDFDYFEKKENVFEVMETVKKSARSFEYHELPGTHHFHLSNPEDIAPAITAFTKRVQ